MFNAIVVVRKWSWVLAAFAAVGTSSCFAKDSADVTAWYAANSTCRGSYSVKEQETACGLRDSLDAKLAKAGMCYGKKSEPNNNLTWHKCGPNSQR
jgi:hypothetical protein